MKHFGISLVFFLLVVTVAGLFLAGTAAPLKEETMKRLTPVLFVEEIEPCLDFWLRLGFEKTTEVPEGEKLGFVILKNGNVEIMLQSRASIAKDIEALGRGPFAKDGVSLFVEVEKLGDILARLGDAEVVVPQRKTFYGAREIGVRSPGGAIILFAEFAEQEKQPQAD